MRRAKSGVNDPAGFCAADLLAPPGRVAGMEQASGGVEVKCPNCGFTQADFKKAGRLGCSECYVTFSEGLKASSKRCTRAPST
jgi:protein arginine kinase activator